MDTDTPLALLGGLTPAQFMRRHWQKKPLLVRGAIEGFTSPIGRAQIVALACREDIEARLISRDGDRWKVRHGPLQRQAFPSMKRPGWTVLLQGMDLHDARAHAVLSQFRFLPDARLDDLMISHASDGGGVGPHFDSYDVFLLQAQGQRRWRIARQNKLDLVPDVPLKILADFTPEQEFVLAPGDMLYLPPRYAHDGIAEGECQTWSVGFRAPKRSELARALLERLADDADVAGDAMYRDPGQPATNSPGAIPPALLDFAREAVESVVAERDALARVLGEYLTEPKDNTWFEGGDAAGGGGVVLDPRTRMMHDARHVFANGESWRAAGRDATVLRRLADARRLSARDLAGAPAAVRELLATWCEAGWAHSVEDDDG